MEHKFTGVRIEITSELSFEEVLGKLRDLTGRAPIAEFNSLIESVSSKEQFHHEVTKHFVGKSDFMIFAEIDHGKWIAKYGIHSRAIRIILGNPLIAITMLRHDISAGLFAPVELLLVDHQNDSGCTLYYVRPSTLMLIEKNDQLAAAAAELDRKLELLVSNATRLRSA